MRKLKIQRVLQGTSQIQLASVTGINQARLSLIENGWVEPRLDEKRRIAETLGLQINEIWADRKAE